jgi:cephalosporin-C deacetylase-like acetyl esterase
VDAERIGFAGHSGGGTLTLFVSVLDERIQCAVVNQGGTRHRWPLRISPGSTVGPADVEQNLFPAALYGADLPDLHVAIAPRPLLALIENYSPSFDAAADEIRRAYKVAGVADRFATEEATDPHAWTVKLRLATTNWFCRWFHNRDGPSHEPRFESEAPETLYCTPSGSIRRSRRGHTIFSIILERQTRVPPYREIPSSTADLDAHRNSLTEELRKLLSYQVDSSQPLGVRHRVTTERKGYRIEKQEFVSESGIYIPAWVFVPGRRGEPYPATLFVNSRGKRYDGMEFGVLEKLAQKGHMVVAVDVRGIGDTQPPHRASIRGHNEFAHLFSVETAMSYMAWFMGDSLFGMRVADLVRSIDYVLSRDDVEKAGVRVIGRGMGALWGLYAAALDTRIRGLLAEHGLLSYRSLTRVDRYLHAANVFLPGVLRHFDLPQVAGAIADRHLAILDPVDPMKKPVDINLARRTYTWTRHAYRNAGADERFELMARRPGADPADAYFAFLDRWSAPPS